MNDIKMIVQDLREVEYTVWWLECALTFKEYF